MKKLTRKQAEIGADLCKELRNMLRKAQSSPDVEVTVPE